ncbi:SseB family protein [Streptomyces sp. NPDC001941]|uniref:SseB family protein n=1 Tax=Streptomyces sp. NPDC001941 TaxID=3154659 RepID=UPI00331EBF06
MTENGDEREGLRLASLTELAGVNGLETSDKARGNSEPPGQDESAELERATGEAQPGVQGTAPAAGMPTAAAAARRGFARLLGEFRRAAVLVPFDGQGSLWTSDFGGVRWICAFSDEQALARFAAARGEAGREWTYQSVLGARLLDVMVPMLPEPGGVALDAGGTEGTLFPPVVGIVPDEVAVIGEGEMAG